MPDFSIWSLRIRADTIQSVSTIIRTEEFAEWFRELRDPKGKARIIAHLDAAALGNFGDCEPVGEGVSEMRVHIGPGYRLYFTRRGRVVRAAAGGRQVDAAAGHQTSHSRWRVNWS